MSSSVFDVATIRALATILAESGLTEIDLTDGDLHIRLSRAAVAVPAAPAVQQAAPIAAAAAAAPAAAAPVQPADHPGTVTSPMVGIAYLAPEPGATPFIAVGMAVTAGQTVMLIEAMKTFNQIKAPRAGTVTRILVSGGAPVEYGEALLVIE